MRVFKIDYGARQALQDPVQSFPSFEGFRPIDSLSGTYPLKKSRALLLNCCRTRRLYNPDPGTEYNTFWTN